MTIFNPFSATPIESSSNLSRLAYVWVSITPDDDNDIVDENDRPFVGVGFYGNSTSDIPLTFSDGGESSLTFTLDRRTCFGTAIKRVFDTGTTINSQSTLLVARPFWRGVDDEGSTGGEGVLFNPFSKYNLTEVPYTWYAFSEADLDDDNDNVNNGLDIGIVIMYLGTGTHIASWLDANGNITTMRLTHGTRVPASITRVRATGTTTLGSTDYLWVGVPFDRQKDAV